MKKLKAVTIWMIELVEERTRNERPSFHHEFYLKYEDAKEQTEKLKEQFKDEPINVRLGGGIL